MDTLRSWSKNDDAVTRKKKGMLMSRERIIKEVLLLLALFFLIFSVGLSSSFAGNPHSAYYSSDNDRVFWFIHMSDIHIGARGDQDSRNLEWIVTQAKNVINPSFIVATGDLTDSTNGNPLGWPNGPYQEEWDEYNAILLSHGVDASFYYDIPGNHEHYNDQYFSYYLSNSIQGQATGETQISWTRDFPFGQYHFLGINTADNTGSGFSLFWPYGDYAGLDASELAFVDQELLSNSDATLSLVFGHHPLSDTGNIIDTYLFYGADEFIQLMDAYGVSLYGNGHLHEFSEDFFIQNMSEGVFYLNVASLGKSTDNHYSIIAVDCNGISAITQSINTWPVVFITAPLDKYLGGVINPYAYSVPNSASNPIRALVFDSNAVTQVFYRIDGVGEWYPMSQVGVTNPSYPYLWEAAWTASTLGEGDHTIEVEATTSSGTRTDVITVDVETSDLLMVVRQRTDSRFRLQIHDLPTTIGDDTGPSIASDNDIGLNVLGIGAGEYDSNMGNELIVMRGDPTSTSIERLYIYDMPKEPRDNTGPAIASDRNIGKTNRYMTVGNFDGDSDTELALLRYVEGSDLYRLFVYDMPATLGGNTGPPIASDRSIGRNIVGILYL
jgi:hypothetical protein